MSALSQSQDITLDCPKKTPKPNDRIYVCFLPTGITEQQIRKMFIEFGEIRRIKIGWRPDGFTFCYVTFSEVKMAQIAIQKMNKFKIGNKMLRVNYALDPLGSIPETISKIEENSICSRCKKAIKNKKKQEKMRVKAKVNKQEPTQEKKVSVQETKTNTQDSMFLIDVEKLVSQTFQDKNIQQLLSDIEKNSEKLATQNKASQKESFDDYLKWLKKKENDQNIYFSEDDEEDNSISTKATLNEDEPSLNRRIKRI